MISNIYTAASGMLTRSKNINIISNNITNVNTTGFKQDGMISTSFDDYMGYKIDNEGADTIGEMTRGATPAAVYTTFEQGTLSGTGRSLDLAISGNGFFTLQQADGTTALTRNGQFSLDSNGYLVSSDGSFVLGNNGPIQIGTADFTVTDGGDIQVNGTTIDTLRITCPASGDSLVKLSDSLYTDTSGTAGTAFTGEIKQGALEESNVNVTEEMSDILAQQRGYQSCSQIIKMMDQINQKAVNELGRL